MFDHGHVLVRGGMVDRVHAEGAVNGLHTLSIAHRTQQTGGFDVAAAPGLQRLEFALDPIQRVLRVVEQNQLAGPGFQNLATELRANGTTGARDHHHLFGDAAIDKFGMGRYGVTAEQVV